MYYPKTIFAFICLILFSSFKFPNEKIFLNRKIKNITVFDAAGKSFPLYNLLGKKPLIISPVYTSCPSVCGLLSFGVKKAITELGTLGKDFNMVSFSFDSLDKESNLASFENRWAMDGTNWKTISADAGSIKELMQSIDFSYDYNPTTKEYDHPSILVVITASGRISRYIYGINPSKKDIRLAVLDAYSEISMPGIFKGFYLKCFSFDPVLKTYKLDWGFLISTFAGLLIIGIVSSIFIKSFIVTK